MKLTTRNNQLLWGGVNCEKLARQYGTPLYVYDEFVIRRQARRLRQAFSACSPRLLYSAKANTNLSILRVLREEGYGLDVVSPGEILLALRVGFSPRDILYTGNNQTEAELCFALSRGVAVTIDSLSALKLFGKLRPGGKLAVRINPAIGAGHHAHVITGGPESKFGVWVGQLEEILRLAAHYRLKIVGLHQHIGSGIRSVQIFLRAMSALLRIADSCPDLEFLNLGGGLGVPYTPRQRPLDVSRLGRAVCQRFRNFCQRYGRRLRLLLEPGRYLVAESGILLTRVTTVKSTPGHTFVGTDSGFNHLIRHPLYGAHHEIVNASRVRGPRQFVAVAGNICESGDLFTHGRNITAPREGDLLAVLNAGAYGYVMANQYNSRPRPAEVMVRAGRSRLIRARETLSDLLRGQTIGN